MFPLKSIEYGFGYTIIESQHIPDSIYLRGTIGLGVRVYGLGCVVLRLTVWGLGCTS